MLREGSPVRIVKGEYAGNDGTVAKTPTGVGPHAMVRVSSPTIDKGEVTIRQTSVEILEEIAATLGALNISAAAANAPATPPPRRKPPPKATPPRAPASYSVPGSREAPLVGGAGDHVVERVVLRPRLVAPKTSNFITSWLGERVMIFEESLPLPPGVELPGRTITTMGRTWELLCAEVEKDEKGGRFGASEKYVLHYVAVSGDGLEPIDLREKLEEIAAFEAQESSTVRKTIARLLLLRSPGFIIDNMTTDQFEIIDEPKCEDGTERLDGCGFIPDEMLFDIAEKMGKSSGALGALRAIIDKEGLRGKVNMCIKAGERGLRQIADDIEAAREAGQARSSEDQSTPPPSALGAALKAVAAQVRVVGPQIGIGKGVLMRKPGITKIQLPGSMIKVGPSESNTKSDWVCLVVKNLFPSAGNALIGKVLVGEELSTSARKELERQLDMRDKKDRAEPGMVQRLLYALGVPESAMKEYERKPVEQATHAWVLGTADPVALRTVAEGAGLPAGPAAAAAAALPEGMAPDLWEWLLALPFGAVIFSGGGSGPPLPLTIADGDLDGDLYFLCWDGTLLSHIRTRELEGEGKGPSYPPVLQADKKPISRGDQWLAEVQEKLADLSMIGDNRYIGKLYNAMVKRLFTIALERGYVEGMDDLEVQAMGMAYTQGLVRAKHGGAIELPDHLHKVV